VSVVASVRLSGVPKAGSSLDHPLAIELAHLGVEERPSPLRPFGVREFRDRSEVLALEEPVVLNCTGLGAAALFGDAELTPVRGPLVFVPPDDRVDYLTIGGGDSVLYMFPRSTASCSAGRSNAAPRT